MHRMKLLLGLTILLATTLALAQTRTTIRAPDAAPPTTPAVSITEPAAAEQLPPARPDSPTRIEQVRQGQRIAEVIVTPGGYSHSYVMVHREPKTPQGPADTGAGLSVPRFVRFSF